MNGERNEILPSRLSLPPRANSTPPSRPPPLLLWKTKTDVKIWDFLFMYTFTGTWNCAGALVLWSDDVKFCLSHALILKFAFLLVCSKDKDNNFFCWHDSSVSVPSQSVSAFSPKTRLASRTHVTYCVKILLLIGSPLGENE